MNIFRILEELSFAKISVITHIESEELQNMWPVLFNDTQFHAKIGQSRILDDVSDRFLKKKKREY